MTNLFFGPALHGRSFKPPHNLNNVRIEYVTATVTTDVYLSGVSKKYDPPILDIFDKFAKLARKLASAAKRMHFPLTIRSHRLGLLY